MDTYTSTLVDIYLPYAPPLYRNTLSLDLRLDRSPLSAALQIEWELKTWRVLTVFP